MQTVLEFYIQQYLTEINFFSSTDHSTYNFEDFQNKKKPLIIVGLSGSGKTTLGKLLSEKYNCPYIEEDELPKKFEPGEEAVGIMLFPQDEFHDLYFMDMTATIRFQDELGKYQVGNIYSVMSYDTKNLLNSVRIKVTKIEKGVLGDWIKYTDKKDVIKNIMAKHNIKENEPSEFIRFDVIRYSLSKTLGKHLNPNKFFVYEGAMLPYLYTNFPHKYKSFMDESKYAFVIVNTSVLTSTWRAYNRNRNSKTGLFKRFGINMDLIKCVNNYGKYLDTLDIDKRMMSNNEITG